MRVILTTRLKYAKISTTVHKADSGFRARSLISIEVILFWYCAVLLILPRDSFADFIRQCGVFMNFICRYLEVSSDLIFQMFQFFNRLKKEIMNSTRMFVILLELFNIRICWPI